MQQHRIAIIGLGYVGLPLALSFSKHFPVVGFDIDRRRIDELGQANDLTRESSADDIRQALGRGLVFTTDRQAISDCNIFIVTVPTPIDNFKSPDLKALLSASRTVGEALKKGDIVIYESTVYPGCTEEDCVPVLEKASGLKFNQDFYCGYSPERINPGDKQRTLENILKITSGSTPAVAQTVDALYRTIISAGTYQAPNLRTAEAAKAIENAQRDVNISFVNELALIFDRMGIDTHEVLAAAGTKWNFLPFKPGLVGGHCIGVDPYYLAHKAQALGYHPQVILSGRRVNDMMGAFVAGKMVKMLIGKGKKIQGSRILILGITFKENCPDVRNTRVVDIVEELREFGLLVDVHDPYAEARLVKEEYGIELISELKPIYDGIILAVGHQQYRDLDPATLKINGQVVVFDTKAFWKKEQVDGRL